MVIGVLALQGNFNQHQALLSRLSVSSSLVRSYQQLRRCHGLIIPGGESTVISILLHKTALFTPLQRAIKNGFPVFGVCAGAIILARSVEGSTTWHGGSMGAAKTRGGAEQYAIEQGAADQDAAGQGDTDQDTAEQNGADQDAAEQNAISQSAAGQNGAEQNGASGMLTQQTLGVLNIDVQRNGYGRQINSFEATIPWVHTSGVGAAGVRAYAAHDPGMCTHVSHTHALNTVHGADIQGDIAQKYPQQLRQSLHQPSPPVQSARPQAATRMQSARPQAATRMQSARPQAATRMQSARMQSARPQAARPQAATRMQSARRQSSSHIRGIFIRAPIIRCCAEPVRPLAYYQARPVVVQQHNILAATFHPELKQDTTLHACFISCCVRQQHDFEYFYAD